MNAHRTKRNMMRIVIFCFAAAIIFSQTGIAAGGGGDEQGQQFFENNQMDKAVAAFKQSLAKEFTAPAPPEIQKAVDTAKSGKVEDAEKAFLPLFDNETTAARSRYELGLIYESKGDIKGRCETCFYQ